MVRVGGGKKRDFPSRERGGKRGRFRNHPTMQKEKRAIGGEEHSPKQKERGSLIEWCAG